MKKTFFQTPFFRGVLVVLGAEIAISLIVYVVLVVMGEPISTNLRFFAASFLAPVFLLRRYSRKGASSRVLKSAIITFFVTFCAFMFLLFKSNAIVL